MRIIYVDDEKNAHINFRHALNARDDIEEVNCFLDYESAMEHARTHEIDCAFLDILLDNGDGIRLAKELKVLQPRIELAFVTGYDEYAREAYKVQGRAFITKPYGDREINDVLALMRRLIPPIDKAIVQEYSDSLHIFAKTFGTFDLIVDGVPVHFKNSKAKELLAFLVHQMGGSTSHPQVFFALWEQQEYTASTSTYVRRTLRALKDELERLDIADILISERNSIALDMRKINCDAYELLFGNATSDCKYNGEYMKQYYWGEDTIPLIERTIENMGF